MQFHKFSLLLCGIIAVLQLQAQAIPQPTRAVTQSTFNSSTPLANERRETYFRLPDDRNDHSLTETWDPVTGTFQLSSAQFFAYDANKNNIARYYNSWDAVNGYTETGRNLRQYNADNLIALDSSVFKDITGTFKPDGVFAYEYSPTQKETMLWRTYYSQNSVNRYRTSTSYDALDRVESVLYEQFDTNLQLWLNTQRYINFYAGNTMQLDSVYNFAQSFSPGILELKGRQIYSYPSALITQWLIESKNGITWLRTGRSTTTKNSNDQFVSQLYETYNSGLNEFFPNNGFEIDFNPDKSIIQFRYYLSDFSNDQYYQSIQVDFDYGIYTGTAAPTLLDAEVAIMPNPVVNSAQIQLRGNAAEQMALYTLTDMQGRVVATGQISGGNAHLSLSGQPSGVYFLRIEQAGAMKVVPVLKR